MEFISIVETAVSQISGLLLPPTALYHEKGTTITSVYSPLEDQNHYDRADEQAPVVCWDG